MKKTYLAPEDQVETSDKMGKKDDLYLDLHLSTDENNKLCIKNKDGNIIVSSRPDFEIIWYANGFFMAKDIVGEKIISVINPTNYFYDEDGQLAKIVSNPFNIRSLPKKVFDRRAMTIYEIIKQFIKYHRECKSDIVVTNNPEIFVEIDGCETKLLKLFNKLNSANSKTK